MAVMRIIPKEHFLAVVERRGLRGNYKLRSLGTLGKILDAKWKPNPCALKPLSCDLVAKGVNDAMDSELCMEVASSHSFN